MSEDQSSTPTWLIILLITLGVVAAVIIALLLAQIDNFQRRSSIPSNGPVISDIEATIAAGELSTIYLQGEAEVTPTTPITPTATVPPPAEPISATPTVSMESGCNQGLDGGIVYIVRRGDTLASLARKSGVSIETLRLVNCLTHDQLIQGQQLFLPQGSEVSAPFDSGCARPSNWKMYKIAPGDTLPKLAHTYGTSVYQIMKANCLENPELIAAGEIVLPNVHQEPVLPQMDN